MLTGRCLCGDVRYEITGPLGPVIYCHCSQCRRASGSAFATNASVAAKNFRITSGKDRLVEYESSPGKLRGFCGRCGSPVSSRVLDAPEIVRVRLGLLDLDPGAEARPVAHLHVGSKAPWFEITDDLPRFEKAAPPVAAAQPGVERADDAAPAARQTKPGH
jgi:hypothetical protein